MQSSVAVLLLCLSVGVFAQKDANFASGRNSIVHLFEWKWNDIADECERFLQPQGFGGVQISPPNEYLVADGRPWWERYQPVSYIINTRSGDESAFTDMTRRCNDAGVRIYVDAVINHMTGMNGVGTSGSSADHDGMNYPAVPYGSGDFHSPCEVNNYQDADNVRNCELVGLRRCRACLGSSDNMKIVSQDEPEAKQLIAMFTSITNFEWITSEKVASCLCNECESALETAYRFQRKCKESNDIIMKELEEDCLQCEEVETQREDSGDEGVKDVTIIKKNKSRVREFSAEEVNQAIYEYKQKQSDGGFTCIVCHYVLATLRALSCHMSQTHKEIYNDWCYICNQTYQDVAEHRRTHTGLVESCRFCNKKIKKKHFVEHLRIHSSVRLFECRVCARGFLTNSSLQSHYNLRHDKTKENVRSSIKKDDCDEDDSSRHDFCEKKVRSLPVQVKSEEEESQTHVCNICNKELKSDGGLKKHLKLHRGDNPHKCSYCGKPHKSRGQLLDHERTHTGEKPYICNVCGKGFAQSGALGTHMKLHTGRPEVCKICQKRFCRPSELKLHLRKHSGEKPFLCTDCGKTFVQKSHLMEHIKTHSDVRPHKCSYCEKAFKQKSLLTSHLQIHSGYKPFQCSLCAYACFKSYRLQQHMKSHNSEVKKDKVHVCPVCQKGFVTQAMLNSHVTSSHNAIL